MAQCYETPKRSIDGDLRLPVADPGTARVSDLAGDRGSCTGEGGFSSAMRGRLSASASSTCTSGCSSVAGTGEGKEDTASERRQLKLTLTMYRFKHSGSSRVRIILMYPVYRGFSI